MVSPFFIVCSLVIFMVIEPGGWLYGSRYPSVFFAVASKCDDLIASCRDGLLEEVVALIEEGFDVDCISYGQAALVEAAYSGQAAIVRALLKAGADPNIKNYSGMNALYYAAINNRETIVHILLRAGSDPDIKDNFSWTAFDMAKKLGHNSVADALRKAGAKKSDEL
jgi:ankyrin repeat protein